MSLSKDYRRTIPHDYPEIITLCGSTKFKQLFIQANYQLTMQGKVVISVGWFSHADQQIYSPTVEEKKALDELHFKKIYIADGIYVINPLCLRCPDCYAWAMPILVKGTERIGPTLQGCRCDLMGRGFEWVPYLGASTRNEIAYAKSLGKTITYLEPM